MTDGLNTIQGVRTYDGNSGQWTTPDAFAGVDVDPASQKPYLWNEGNPFQNEDPSGFMVNNSPPVPPGNNTYQFFWPGDVAGSSPPSPRCMLFACAAGAKRVIATVVAHAKPAPRRKAPAIDYMQSTFCIGAVFGGCVSLTEDKCGHKYVGLSGTVGRADPFSETLTANSLFGNDHSEGAIQGALKGPGYQGAAGFWAGGQLSGSAWPPQLPSSGGGGFVTPQLGGSLGWTWETSKNSKC
jgi:hypothetical protein